MKGTYGFESNRLSPPRLRLPNCIPTFSMPDPNELGITTGWSIVLYRALLRCVTAAGRELSFGEGVTAGPWDNTGVTSGAWGTGSDFEAGSCCSTGGSGVGGSLTASTSTSCCCDGCDSASPFESSGSSDTEDGQASVVDAGGFT